MELMYTIHKTNCSFIMNDDTIHIEDTTIIIIKGLDNYVLEIKANFV